MDTRSKRLRDALLAEEDINSDESRRDGAQPIRKKAIFFRKYQQNNHDCSRYHQKNSNQYISVKEPETIPELSDGKYFSIFTQNEIKIEAQCKACGKIRKG